MKLKRILFGVLGLLSTILSIVSFSMSRGLHVSYKTYGGDAYTGIQNAAAQTANNLRYVSEIAAFGFGSVLLIAGLLLIVLAITMEEPIYKNINYNAVISGVSDIKESVSEIKSALLKKVSENEEVEQS